MTAYFSDPRLTSFSRFHTMNQYPNPSNQVVLRKNTKGKIDMSDNTLSQYNSDDVNRIIRRALKIEQSDSISHKELLETARELGIDPKRIETAIEEESATIQREKARNQYLSRKRSRFQSQLWSYIIINTALIIINSLTPGPWWFQWVLLGWGIGLALNFRKTYFPTPYQVERATRKILRQKRAIRRISRRN